ncbi:hypothetical protein SH528x_005805 [Novipirellula sp. SH528]|uniref:hypothetical protein n=1 Tax=Novipirellula sp. SH528 TaxID=3454466 RepID=UPI003F9EF0CF
MGTSKFVAASFTIATLMIAYPSPTQADWHCACGAIVHVNYPTTCPVCGRNLPNSPPSFTPPFTPPGPRPGPGSTAPDSSGVTLGVNIYNAGSRVIVQSVMPGTPAQGRLFPNDQLVKGAFRDPLSRQVHRVFIHSPADVTRLKTMAGAGTRVALQVYRPTTGVRNFLVNFEAPGGTTTQAYQLQADGQPQALRSTSPAAAMISDDVNGEAASMLGSDDAGGGGDYAPTVNPGAGQNPDYNPRPDYNPNPNFGPGNQGDTADDLLGGN